MCGHVQGVEPGLKHAVWHQDIATPTILHELPVIQMHWFVYKRETEGEGGGEMEGEREGEREGEMREQRYASGRVSR